MKEAYSSAYRNFVDSAVVGNTLSQITDLLCSSVICGPTIIIIIIIIIITSIYIAPFKIPKVALQEWE